jgi:diguanylate cyclase (GGDEF)-like protein/PAS domain S-box-containing protein
MAHAAGLTGPRRARPFVVALGVTASLMALSLVVALVWRSRLQGAGREQFELDATQVEQVVVQRLQSAIDLVRDTRGSVTTEPVDAETFERMVAETLPVQLPSLVTVSMVEAVGRDDLAAFQAEHRDAGLTGFRVRSAEPGDADLAVATFEASTRAAPILSGYDLRSTPALNRALREREASTVRMTSLLTPLPRAVLRVHPDLGGSAFALVTPAGRGTWIVAVLSGSELARQAVTVADELDVVLSVGEDALGASAATSDGVAVDLAGAPAEARTSWEFPIVGGPLQVTIADLDGLAGGGWREPGMLLGAGLALSVLVGSLILVLARGRAGALAIASEAQEAQARSEQHFRAVVQHLSDLVLVVDEDFRVMFVTPSVSQLLGRDPTAVGARSLLELVHPDDQALLSSLTRRLGVSDVALVRFRHSDSEYRSFEVNVANRLDDPAIGGLVLTGHDVTGRIQLEDRLSHDATHDALTGLPNRALIRDRLEHALARAERTEGRVAVVFGDLDDFKVVNDEHGHLVGDQLLATVARRLRGAARAMDTVGRWAGDEFVVVCEELIDEPAALHVAHRLHHEAARPVTVEDGRQLDVQMSLGVALAEPGEGAEAVIDRADQAMYVAKADHRIVLAARETAA